MSLENPFYNQSRDEKLKKEEAEIKEEGGENIQRNNSRLIRKIFEFATEGGKNFKRALRALTLMAALSPFMGEMGRAEGGWFLPSEEVATRTLEEEGGTIANEWAKRRDAELEQTQKGVGWKEQLDAEVSRGEYITEESEGAKEDRLAKEKRKEEIDEYMKKYPHYVVGVGKMTEEEHQAYQIKKMELNAQQESDAAKREDMYEFIRLSKGLNRQQSRPSKVNINLNYKSHNK